MSTLGEKIKIEREKNHQENIETVEACMKRSKTIKEACQKANIPQRTYYVSVEYFKRHDRYQNQYEKKSNRELSKIVDGKLRNAKKENLNVEIISSIDKNLDNFQTPIKKKKISDADSFFGVSNFIEGQRKLAENNKI